MALSPHILHLIFSFPPKRIRSLLIFFFNIFFAVQVKVLDHNLALVPGRGIEGKVWFKGCLERRCLTYPVWLDLSVLSENGAKTVKTGSIRPGLEPFPVNGLLERTCANSVNDLVTVHVKYGPGSSYPYGEDLKSKFTSVSAYPLYMSSTSAKLTLLRFFSFSSVCSLKSSKNVKYQRYCGKGLKRMHMKSRRPSEAFLGELHFLRLYLTLFYLSFRSYA